MVLFLRKTLGFAFTAFFIGVFLSLYFAILSGSNFFFGIGLFSTGAFPFVLLIGVPVLCLSDYLTKNLNGKPRYKVALLIHSLFGLIAGLAISYLFEREYIFLVITIIAALIFWLVDEMLREKM